MHNKIKRRKLGRTASHRKALLRNLANQLIEHKEIRTTTAKAKEARSYIERLITYAKKGDLHHRRLAFAFLRNKQSINILFDEIAPAYSERQGGYTRVVKLGNRAGDSAPISLLQLVDFEKVGESPKKKSAKKKSKPTESKDTKTQEKDIKAPDAETFEKETIPEAEVVENVSVEESKEEKAEQEVPELEEKTEVPVVSDEEKKEEDNEASEPEDEEKKEDKKE